MMGRTHVLGAAAAGLAAGTFVLHLHGVPLAEFTGITAAMGTISDIDQHGSCASRSLGFLSGAVARVMHRVTGGHRHFTHTLPGAVAFGAAAWAGGHWRHDAAGVAALALLLALAFAGAARALAIPGHLDDLAAVAAAVAMAVTGYGLALVPLAAGLGVVAHMAADGLTKEGIPLAWPLTSRHFRWWPPPLAFTTGTRPEHAVAAGFVLVLAVLAAHAAGVPVPHVIHGHLAL
jgi:membrane-bound metal-dependent hydrolase YbcI (DUF457 family)